MKPMFQLTNCLTVRSVSDSKQNLLGKIKRKKRKEEFGEKKQSFPSTYKNG